MLKKMSVQHRLVWKIFLIFGVPFFIYILYIETNRMEVSKIDIRINGLSEALNGLSIVHLSDLHLEKLGAREEKLLDAVNEINPDILVVTGDFVNTRKALDDCIQLINKFRAKYGKWGVWGNYDHLHLTPTDMEKIDVESDVVFLNNKNQKIKIRQENIWLVGVDDPFSGRDNLSRAIDGIPKDDFKILLSHSPVIIKQADRHRIELVLAGHTHGGQIYIPLFSHLVVKLLGGGGFISGLYRISQTQMYVTRGIGRSILPIRLFSPSEITVIKLEEADF